MTSLTGLVTAQSVTELRVVPVSVDRALAKAA